MMGRRGGSLAACLLWTVLTFSVSASVQPLDVSKAVDVEEGGNIYLSEDGSISGINGRREDEVPTAAPTPTTTAAPTSLFCTATRCKNGGSCVVGDTKCTCVNGYSGKTCALTPAPSSVPPSSVPTQGPSTAKPSTAGPTAAKTKKPTQTPTAKPTGTCGTDGYKDALGTCRVATSGILGCFIDCQFGFLPLQRDFPVLKIDFNAPNSYESCAAACAGYAYFALQYTGQCFCGDKFGGQGISSACTNKCGGDLTETCGASCRNTVGVVDYFGGKCASGYYKSSTNVCKACPTGLVSLKGSIGSSACRSPSDVCAPGFTFLAPGVCTDLTVHTLRITVKPDQVLNLAEVVINGNGIANITPSLTGLSTYLAAECFDNDVSTNCISPSTGATLTVLYTGAATSVTVKNYFATCCKDRINGATVTLDGEFAYTFPSISQPEYTFEICGTDGYKDALGFCRVPTSGILGCFTDCKNGILPLQRDLPVQKIDFNAPASYESCAAACAGYAYFGLQYTGQCWCGDKFGGQGIVSTCTNKCSGDLTETCGASCRNTVGVVNYYGDKCASGFYKDSTNVCKACPAGLTSLKGATGSSACHSPSDVCASGFTFLAPGVCTDLTVHTVLITTKTDQVLNLAEVIINGNEIANITPSLTGVGTYIAAECFDNDISTNCIAPSTGATLTVKFTGTATGITVKNYGATCCKDRINGAKVTFDGGLIFIFPSVSQFEYSFGVP